MTHALVVAMALGLSLELEMPKWRKEGLLKGRAVVLSMIINIF